MLKGKKSVVLKDGITITRNCLVLNLNKNRRYSISYNEKRLYSSLLYSELLNYIAISRSLIK